MMISKTSQLAISMVKSTMKENEWNQKMHATHVRVDEILKTSQHTKIDIVRELTATLTCIIVIKFMTDVFQFITKLRIGKNKLIQFLKPSEFSKSTHILAVQ